MLSQLWTFIAALLPSAGLLYLFVMVIKHIVDGDRRERVSQRQWEAEQDAAANAEPASVSSQDKPGE